MLNLFIFLIGGIVSLLTTFGFVLALGAVAVGVLAPIVMPLLFGDHDSGPFGSAGGAMAA